MYLYILLIIILVLLLCNQNKVREGFNVKGNIVEYKGSQYRTLSGLNPREAGTRAQCELGSYNPWGRGKMQARYGARGEDTGWGWKMPPGWKLAPFNKKSYEVATKFPWGTTLMVIGDSEAHSMGWGTPRVERGGGVQFWTAGRYPTNASRAFGGGVSRSVMSTTNWEVIKRWAFGGYQKRVAHIKNMVRNPSIASYGKRLVGGQLKKGAVYGRWTWPRIRRTVNGINYYSTGTPCPAAILLIKGGKKPKPKIGLKKCPGVWHDLKSQLGYYDIRKHANPEQVCLAKCREDSNCKAAQVQFGKLPKVKVKSAGTPLVRGKSVFYKNYEYRTAGPSCPTSSNDGLMRGRRTAGCNDGGCGGRTTSGCCRLKKNAGATIPPGWEWVNRADKDVKKVAQSYPWGTEFLIVGTLHNPYNQTFLYTKRRGAFPRGFSGISGWPKWRPGVKKLKSGRLIPTACYSRLLMRRKSGGAKADVSKGDSKRRRRAREGPMRCWTYSSDKAKKSTNNSKTAAYFKDKGRSCSVPKPPPPKKVKKIVAVKKPLKKVPLKKRVLKLRKNTNCPDGLKIKSHSECWQALKKLGLFSRTHWTGKDPKVPIGCSWTNSVSAVGKSMGLWNYSLSGKARYDLHPICYRPPLAPQKTTGILKAINKRLLEKSIEKEEDPVPIALTVGVSKDSQKKVTSSQSLFKEAMSVLGDQYKINHFRDQGSGQRSKTNSDLSNHAPFVREGFDVKMTGKVPDDFKALATNAFLIDMAHLKGEDLTGVPVNLNLSLNDGGEKTIEQV